MVNEKIKISGIAIREGISRNRIKYKSEELKKFAPTLTNKPILKDHEGITDNVIGIVERGDYLEDGKLVTYEGWIKEDGTGLVEKIKDGRIKEVSIGAIAGKVVKEKEDDDFIVVKDLESMELSTTPVPGVKGTSLNIGEGYLDLSEKGVKNLIQNYEKLQESNNHISNNQKEVNMTESTESQKESVLVAEEKVKSDKILAEKTEALEFANKSIKELEEARRQDAISRYKEKSKAKGLKLKDLSNASLESITLLTEQVDDIPEPKSEVEEPAEDEVKDKPAEDSTEDEVSEEKTKIVATPKTKIGSAKTIVNSFADYVLDSSESKIAFYKWY